MPVWAGRNGERKIRANLSTYEEQLKQFGFIKISQGMQSDCTEELCRTAGIEEI